MKATCAFSMQPPQRKQQRRQHNVPLLLRRGYISILLALWLSAVVTVNALLTTPSSPLSSTISRWQAQKRSRIRAPNLPFRVADDNNCSNGSNNNNAFCRRLREDTTRKTAVLINGSSDTEAIDNVNGSAAEDDNDDELSSLSSSLTEVNVLYGRRTSLTYDPVQGRFIQTKESSENDSVGGRRGTGKLASSSSSLPIVSFFSRCVLPRLRLAFIPAGVTPNYYNFVTWRVLQRFISSNLHVLGTQSLLLGLGIQSQASTKLGALAAALNWVLKDALGKIVRMLWASKMGLRFDSDAKRWRFRAAFIFALGNWFECVTYMFPALFLVTATLANCCKQVSMLTASSTRTGVYNSFRDGTRENIGDITAKGEAQIAVVDLIGIASGVAMTKHFVGTSVRRVFAAYAVLQALEIVCMYRQLKNVIYRVLNFERMVSVISGFCQSAIPAMSSAVQGPPGGVGASSPSRATAIGNNGSSHSDDDLDRRAARLKLLRGAASSAAATAADTSNAVRTPEEMARTERLFWPKARLSRRETAFGSLGRARLSPIELNRLFDIFRGERFLLVVGPNVKKDRNRRELFGTNSNKTSDRLQENCHVVLHTEATNMDIVKSTLALVLLRHKLALAAEANEVGRQLPAIPRSADCYDLIEDSLQESDALFPVLLKQMAKKGWESPARFMFGRVHMRAEWPLKSRR